MWLTLVLDESALPVPPSPARVMAVPPADADTSIVVAVFATT